MAQISYQINPAGPLIDVLIGVSKPREDALKKASSPVPARLTVRALVDTGASCTCIDPTVVQQLSLSATGTTPMHTGSTGGQAHICAQYDISLPIPLNGPTATFATISVSEINLTGQPFDVLIGRDVLAACLMVYDGKSKAFTMAF